MPKKTVVLIQILHHLCLSEIFYRAGLVVCIRLMPRFLDRHQLPGEHWTKDVAVRTARRFFISPHSSAMRRRQAPFDTSVRTARSRQCGVGCQTLRKVVDTSCRAVVRNGRELSAWCGIVWFRYLLLWLHIRQLSFLSFQCTPSAPHTSVVHGRYRGVV